MATHDRAAANVRDASMRAHDAFAIPLPHLRRRGSGNGGGGGGGGGGGEAGPGPGGGGGGGAGAADLAALGFVEQQMQQTRHGVGATAAGLCSAVSGSSLATPTAAEDAAVVALLVAERSPAALLRLRAMLADRPAAAPAAVSALRRTLLGKPNYPSVAPPDAAVDATQFLMETSPYFYRYVANDKFFDALWRLASVDEFRARILGLIRDWALALRAQFPRRDTDPAATFWKDKYDALYKSIIFPPAPALLAGPSAHIAVCPTSLSDRRRHVLPEASPAPLDLRTRDTENWSTSSRESAELAINFNLEALLPGPLRRRQRRAARRASCASAEEVKAGGYRRLLPSRPHKQQRKETRLGTERRSYEAVSRMLESMSPITDDDACAAQPAVGEASSPLCRDTVLPLARNPSASSAGSSVAAIARGRARERLAQSKGVDVSDDPVGPLRAGRKNSDGPLAKLLQCPDGGRSPASETDARLCVDPSDLAFDVDGLDDYVPREPSQFSVYAGASEPETELGNSL